MSEDKLLRIERLFHGDRDTSGPIDKELFNKFVELYRADKLHHAHLIIGRGETVKLNTVREFACYVFSEHKSNEKTCKAIRAGSFPFFKIYRPEGEKFRIDTVRRLKADAYMASDTYRIFYLANVERMTYQAVSALLKLLEEPPPLVILFLSSARVNLPLTILSRTVRHTVNSRIPLELKSALLDMGLSEDEIEELVELSEDDIDSFEVLVKDALSERLSFKLKEVLQSSLKYRRPELLWELAEPMLSDVRKNLQIFLKVFCYILRREIFEEDEYLALKLIDEVLGLAYRIYGQLNVLNPRTVVYTILGKLHLSLTQDTRYHYQ